MNKETYSYYKRAYKANKRYRDKIGNDDYAGMLSEKDWRLQHKEVSNQEIVYNQFHYFSKDKAKEIQKTLKESDIKLSLVNIQTRNFTPEVYDVIKDKYFDLRNSGMSSKEASTLIAYMYFGS